MYQVIGHRMTRAFRVLWALEEIGAPYTHLPLAPASPEARAITPSGKVPVLIEGEAVISDSTAILTYLADKHGALTYAPGTLARAHQDSLTQMILDEVDALLWVAARHSFVLPAERRIPEIKPALHWEFERFQERLVARMASNLERGPFLMGETFTLPDIVLTHCLGWSISAKFPPLLPELKAYGQAMRARPAYVRAAAL